jgi:hypothetical protein
MDRRRRPGQSPHATHATKIPVTIESGDQKIRIEFDETQPIPAGEAFRNACIIKLSSDADTTGTFSNTATDGFVILDAIQLLEVKD